MSCAAAEPVTRKPSPRTLANERSPRHGARLLPHLIHCTRSFTGESGDELCIRPAHPRLLHSTFYYVESARRLLLSYLAKHPVGDNPVFLSVRPAVWEVVRRVAIGPRVRPEKKLGLPPLGLPSHDAEVSSVSPQ